MATDLRKTRRKTIAGHEDGYRPYRFTAEQVLKMVDAEIIPEDSTTELLDGVLYQVSKSELHNMIVDTIGDPLRRLCPGGHHVREDKSRRAGEWSMPEPDVAICRGERFAHVPHLPPLETMALVIEVCQSTPKHDRVIKFGMYAAAGIPCYWIVDAKARNVTVWTEPAQFKRRSAKYTAQVLSEVGQSIPVVIDGQPLGAVNVAEFFSSDKPS